MLEGSAPARPALTLWLTRTSLWLWQHQTKSEEKHMCLGSPAPEVEGCACRGDCPVWVQWSLMCPGTWKMDCAIPQKSSMCLDPHQLSDGPKNVAPVLNLRRVSSAEKGVILTTTGMVLNDMKRQEVGRELPGPQADGQEETWRSLLSG